MSKKIRKVCSISEFINSNEQFSISGKIGGTRYFFIDTVSWCFQYHI